MCFKGVVKFIWPGVSDFIELPSCKATFSQPRDEEMLSSITKMLAQPKSRAANVNLGKIDFNIGPILVSIQRDMG